MTRFILNIIKGVEIIIDKIQKYKIQKNKGI